MTTARFVLAAVLGALLACAPPAATPEEVALEFWSAVVAGDAQRAASVADGSAEALAALLGESPSDAPPAIGAAATSEESALVETIFLHEGVAAPQRFHTHLTRGETGWRVALHETADEFARASAQRP